MRDPHVAKLCYRLVPAKTVSFDQPPPVEREIGWFRMRLADDIVTFEMVEHHDSEESARQRVDPYLQAWELDVALSFGQREISFQFQDADIIDRDPPLPGTGRVIYAKAAIAAGAALSATAHVSQPQYPSPPEGFVVSLDVETMWHRYEGYLAGREPLAAMAYFCLTVLQGSAGGRDEAAEQYGISGKVLDTLGRLTTEIGDEETARKFDRVRHRRRHTGAERAWIEAAVKVLIRRAGEWEASRQAPQPQVTMNDLPKVTSP